MMDKLSLLPLALLVGASGVAQDQPTSIDVALSKARARAKVHNTRVLVVLDRDGTDLATKLKRTRSVSRTLLYEFETVPVTADAVASCAGRLHVPAERSGLAILAATGELRSWVAASAFVTRGKVDGVKLLALLQPHFCPPADAEQKLAAALAVAKKTGRNVLLHFSAPW